MRNFVVTSIVLAALVSLVGCDKDAPITPLPSPDIELESLPKDTGGQQLPYPLGSNASPYGYYVYTPSAYSASGPKFPLMIFMHGAGELGNSLTDPAELKRILVNGPPMLIDKKRWVPMYPMIVASIQCHESSWDPVKVKKFTEYMMANFQVDTSRIYMTGLSLGAIGTWDVLCTYGKSSHVTAAIPISGSTSSTDTRVKLAAQIPIWAFHGENDRVVYPTYDKAIWAAINGTNPLVRAKLTIFSEFEHDCWTVTYDGRGMTARQDPGYDTFGMDIYKWLFRFKK